MAVGQRDSGGTCLPAPSDDRVKELIRRFVHLYDGGRWRRALLAWPDEERDGAVDALATLDGDEALAIEHTLIEPFEGNQEEIQRLKRHFLPIEEDASLKALGVASYVDVSRDALVRGAPCTSTADALQRWLQANLTSLPVDNGVHFHDCPCEGWRPFRITVRRVDLQDNTTAYLLIRRFGDQTIPVVIEKALRRKVGKLADTPATHRVLILERQDWMLSERALIAELYRAGAERSDLQWICEVWIAEVTLPEADAFVDFKLYDRDGVMRRSFSFRHGVPFDASEDGVPWMLKAPE